jgi:hypothetical protein
MTLYVCGCTATFGDSPERCPECGRLSRPYPEDYEGNEGVDQSGAVNTLPLESLSSIKPKLVRWLWCKRVPHGKVTVFGGDVGVGKSLVSVDMVARASTGRGYPGDEDAREPIDALMFFCEDGAEDTVVPRLMAAGADLSRVKWVRSTFELDKDLDLLEGALRQHPSIKLIVMDPASSYLGSVNLEKEREVRKALMPVAQLAERLDVTINLILHFNKRGDVKAIHRLMGAVAFSGVARAVWLFGEDPDNENDFLMLCGKLNLARKPEALRYGIVEQDVTIEGQSTKVSRVEWKGTSKVDAERVIGVFAARDRAGKVDEACKWLEQFLAGDKPAREAHEAAKQQGISPRTLKRAKAKLGVESEKTEEGWVWHRPEPEPDVDVFDGAAAPEPTVP